jgi:hypothetical protein
MKEFLKKYKIYILAGSLVILIGSFFYWGIFCSIKSIKINANEAQKRTIDNEINQKKLAKIPQMQKTFGELEENNKKLRSSLKKEDQVDFIKKIEILAEETQNKIDLKIIDEGQKDNAKTKVKSESKIKLPSNEYISLQANLSGNYSNLYNFIKRMENFEYYVNIISISSSLEEDKSIAETSNANLFAGNSSENGQSAVTPETKPKFLLKTQINFVAYIEN